MEDIKKEEKNPEKEEEDKVLELKNKEMDKKHNKQLGAILMVMIGIFLTIAIMILVMQSIANFEYKGLNFQKSKFGNIPIYRFALNFVTHASGGMTSQVTREFAFRNDPRQLDVPVNIKQLVFTKDMTYISISPEMTKCEDTGIAIANIAQLLGAADIQLSTGTDDLETSEQQGVPYVPCSSEMNATVILIQESEESSIVQRGKCYEINIANCEVLDSTERFMLESAVTFIKY